MAIDFFQKRIEEIINNILGAEGSASLTTEQLDQISSQLALYFSTILLTLLGSLLITILVLWIVKCRSDSSTIVNKELERQRLLPALETQFMAINNQPAVWITNRSTFDAKAVYEFSLALTREVSWHIPQHIQTSWHMGDHMTVFTEQGDLLTASLLDEILFWFRRLDRAVSGEIIKVKDIYSLWRQILPFAIDNRFSFIAAYFAKDQRGSLEDISSIRQVLIGVIRYSQQQKLSQPLSYINGRLDLLFFDELPKGMKAGLKAAHQETASHQDPIVTDESPITTQETKTERKEPIILNPGKITARPKNTARKEPTVSFDNVDTKNSE